MKIGLLESTFFSVVSIVHYFSMSYYNVMERSTHNLKIKLKREHKHKEWLERNLQNSKQLKETKKSILKLYTKIAENEKAKQ